MRNRSNLKTLHGFVIAPSIGFGDNVFLTSLISESLIKAKKQLLQHNTINPQEKISYILTIFAYKTGYSVYLGFPHDHIFILDKWKLGKSSLRRWKIIFHLIIKAIIFRNPYQFCVAYKSQKWLIKWFIKLSIMKAPAWDVQFKPFEFFGNERWLIPCNQIQKMHIPYHPFIPIPKEDFVKGKHIVAENACIVIAPWTSNLHKDWDKGYWETLLKSLNKVYENHQFLFLGSQNDEEKIQPLLRCVHKGKALLGLSYTTIAAVITYSKLFIGLETGTLNLAIALVYLGYDIKVIGICGIKEKVLNPRKDPRVRFVSPPRTYELDEEIHYILHEKPNVSMIATLNPQQVLNAIQHHY